MSPLEWCARVWHYQGLRAVNPPQPAEGTNTPPSVFLLFEAETDARAAARAVEKDPPYPRPRHGALGTRLSFRQSNRFRYWTSSGSPEQALGSGARTMGRRGESREGQRRRAGSPTASPRDGEPPARRRRGEEWPSESDPDRASAGDPPVRSPPPADPSPGRYHPEASPPRMIDADLLMDLLSRGFLHGARVPSPQEEPLRPVERAGAAGAVAADRGGPEVVDNAAARAGHDADRAEGNRYVHGQQPTATNPPRLAERSDHPQQPERWDYHIPAGRCTQAATVGCIGDPHDGCALRFCTSHGRRVARRGCPLLDLLDTNDEDGASWASVQRAYHPYRPAVATHQQRVETDYEYQRPRRWRDADHGREEEDH